ncbi:hypothetical protein B0H11DRAFT_2274382 [Mycena galericulata]|nr:hypothetical protein B0H11DRAFT_2274382 [Mycena galericulata]
MSSPPAKRQRTEDALMTRSNVWYKDGSVVLQAQNTQFRVHWGVLAQNSSFFHDMQELPQPPDQPNVDGCPIVELSDTTEDVEYLLKALYSPTFLTQKALPFPPIAALVRLGRKYDFRELLEEAIERIMFENPTTLKEYDARHDSRPLTFAQFAWNSHITTRIVPYAGILSDMLTVARENNIFSALPCAYYRLLEYSTQEEVFDGLPRPGETSPSLAPIDIRRCVLGREKLVQAQWKTGNTQEWLILGSSYYSGCTSSRKCTAFRREHLQHLLANGSLSPFGHLPLEANYNCCDSCLHCAQELIPSGRQNMWDKLPGFFDLAPWGELKNDL